MVRIQGVTWLGLTRLGFIAMAKLGYSDVIFTVTTIIFRFRGTVLIGFTEVCNGILDKAICTRLLPLTRCVHYPNRSRD